MTRNTETCKPRKSACRKPASRKPASRKCSSKPRKKCSKPGPVTNNGYLNFLRSYRRKHCGLKPKELIIKAARAWNRLPENKKDFYRRMACKVTNSPRHKARPICRHCNKE